MSSALKLTEKGQITLKKEFLQHLGVLKGGYVDVLKLPDGSLQIKAERQGGKIEEVFGVLANKSPVRLTIEEINEAIAEGYSQAGMQGLKE